MAQVSKYPLSKTTEFRLYSLFWEAIADLKNPAKAEEFFNDLLTPTEKVMLSKRLAIAVMLIKGYDYSSIRSILKVSPTTIGAVSLWLKYSGKGYRDTVEKLLKKERVREIVDTIDSLLETIKPQRTLSKTLQKGFPKGKFKEPF